MLLDDFEMGADDFFVLFEIAEFFLQKRAHIVVIFLSLLEILKLHSHLKVLFFQYYILRLEFG